MKYEVDSIDESIVTLDSYNSDLNLVIDGSNYSAHPLTKEGFAFMWAGARATHGAGKSKFCFEAKVIEYLDVSHLPADEPNPHVVRVGFSVDSSSLQLGEDPLSYGYGGTGKISTNGQFKDFGPPFKAEDVILAAVDMDSDPIQIGFAKNGTFIGWAYKVKKSELQGKVLFPHVLTKNCSFEVNFGQRQEPYFKLPDAVKSFSFIGCMPADLRIGGTRPPAKREDCEMIMMCGLPGAGKSVWAAEYSKKNPDKKYNVLGTNNIIDKMKVMGLPRKRNYHGRWDVLIQMATKCLNSMFAIGSKLRRNYILDQTNVYPTAQRRKMRNFDGFKRVAVVVVPTEAEYKRRCDKRDREEGKEIPDSAILEMKANFKLPEVNDIFDDVIFTEVQREEAEKLVTEYNEEGKAALGPARKQFRPNESERQGNFGYNRNESSGNRGGFGGNFRGDHGMRGHNSYGGSRGGFNDRGGFNGGRGGGFDSGRGGGRSGGFDGGRSGGFDGGRSGGFDGGRSGGFDGGRSGGFDGGRSGGFDGGRSGGFDGGRGGGFDSGYGGRDYKAGSGGFGDKGGYDGSGGFGDRSGYENRGGREGFDGSYGGGRGGYDNSMSSGRGNFGGSYDGNRGSSRGGFDGNRGRGSFDNGRGRGGNRGGGRGGYDGNRGGGRGGYDGNRGGGRGGFDNNRGGGRGGHDGNRGGRGSYDGNRGGGRGGYDNNRGGGRSDFGGRGSSRGDSYDSRSDAYSSYSGPSADSAGSNYGSGYGSDRGYDKSNRSGQSGDMYGSSYGTTENIPGSAQRGSYGYSDYSSESYSDQGYGNNSSGDFKRGSSNSRFQQSNRGTSRGGSRGGYQNESYSKDNAYSSSYSSGGSTSVQSSYSDKSYGYGTGGYGQSTDSYTPRDSLSSYSSGSQNVKSEGSKFAGSNFDSSSSYSQGTGYSAAPARKTRWSAAETPTTVAPAVETYTSTTAQSYAYPKSDSSAVTTTYQPNQTYGYQQASTLTAAVPQPAVASSVPAAANTTGYAEWMQAQWMQYGQQYYTQ